ncbi:MAG: amidohydrolase family protein [Ruminococcus sp.]
MITDIHMHIGGEALGFHMTKEMVLEVFEKYSVGYGMISDCDGGECDNQHNIIPEELQVTQEESLRNAVEFARENPGKFCIAAWIRPRVQGITDEFCNIVEENLDIIKAIKIHPFASDVSPVDKRVIPYIELAKKHNLFVISHTGGSEKASCENLYRAAKMFPSIPFVMAHMGLGTDNSQALELMNKADNLFGDTAWVPMETAVKAVERFGSEKMFFGTDAPIDGVDTYKCNPRGERSVYVDYFEKLPQIIGDRAYEDLMYKNARDILNVYPAK